MKPDCRWQVVEIDLVGELPQLDIAPGYSGVRVIYRHRGRPLGHSDFTAAELPLSPTQLAMAAAHRSSAAIGDCLLEEGFHSALPGLPEPKLADPCGTLQRLVKENRP